MPASHRILMFHKPKGLTVTTHDELGRKTVYSALPDWVRQQGFIPVGRLDLDTRGLLLFVQEGKLMDRLSRPGSCRKRYEVWVRGMLGEAQVAEMLRGVESPVGLLRAVAVELRGGAGGKSRVMITLDEGKNRHIRRMVAGLSVAEGAAGGFKVTDLKRVSFGPLELDVASGEWRELTPEEVEQLIAAVGGLKQWA